MMQASGINPDVIDPCQNQVLPGSKVRRHHLYHDYKEKKRQAWQLLGKRLDAVLSNNDNVLSFFKAAWLASPFWNCSHRCK